MTTHNTDVMTSSVDMDWITPQTFVDSLPFAFDVDVCATRGNTKARHWIEPQHDALTCDWSYSQEHTFCWMNPPYGRDIGVWIEKAHEESLKGCTVVCLVPNRTETHWFHRIWQDASCICFLGKRIKFEHPDTKKSDSGAPFANVLAIFGRIEEREYAARELSRHGTTILPGAGNIWLHGSKG